MHEALTGLADTADLALSAVRDVAGESGLEPAAQLIDDANGVTLAAASSRDKDIQAQKLNKVEKSKLVGEAIARKATELGIKDVTFDRGGYLYHGRVKSVAEGARQGGLLF